MTNHQQFRSTPGTRWLLLNSEGSLHTAKAMKAKHGFQKYMSRTHQHMVKTYQNHMLSFNFPGQNMSRPGRCTLLRCGCNGPNMHCLRGSCFTLLGMSRSIRYRGIAWSFWSLLLQISQIHPATMLQLGLWEVNIHFGASYLPVTVPQMNNQTNSHWGKFQPELPTPAPGPAKRGRHNSWVFMEIMDYHGITTSQLQFQWLIVGPKIG